MAPNELPEGLSAAYRDADQRLRTVQAEATRRVQDAMSATPGWQAASKAAAAHAVLVASRCETETLLTDLFRAHVDAGERNPEKVARHVREFLTRLSAPGLGFFEGSSAEAASLKPIALRHAAEFESWRDALAADIVDRFRRTLDAHPKRDRQDEAHGTRWGLGENRVLLGLLLLTTAMSLCGVSWLDIARRAFTLF